MVSAKATGENKGKLVRPRTQPAFSAQVVGKWILIIRGQRVMLDSDLARLYGVSTKRLNEQVKRNRNRFPADFMFRLTAEEKMEVVANCDHLRRIKFSAVLPYAFTEHGAVMLASVLNSYVAVQASVQVVRAFVRLRKILAASADRRAAPQVEHDAAREFAMQLRVARHHLGGGATANVIGRLCGRMARIDAIKIAAGRQNVGASARRRARRAGLDEAARKRGDEGTPGGTPHRIVVGATQHPRHDPRREREAERSQEAVGIPASPDNSREQSDGGRWGGSQPSGGQHQRDGAHQKRSLPCRLERKSGGSQAARRLQVEDQHGL